MGVVGTKQFFLKPWLKETIPGEAGPRILPKTEGWVREVEAKPCDYVSMEFKTGVFQEGRGDL